MPVNSCARIWWDAGLNQYVCDQQLVVDTYQKSAVQEMDIILCGFQLSDSPPTPPDGYVASKGLPAVAFSPGASEFVTSTFFWPGPQSKGDQTIKISVPATPTRGVSAYNIALWIPVNGVPQWVGIKPGSKNQGSGAGGGGDPATHEIVIGDPS